jgi:hypothetical protein
MWLLEKRPRLTGVTKGKFDCVSTSWHFMLCWSR